jgi:NAD(P)-dependent dehydrogenase (short-subunit alcohol dehydrogenase family)
MTKAGSSRRVIVIGATGDVGRGVVTEALDGGWSVVAVSRRRGSLDELASELVHERLSVQEGSLASDAEAVSLVGKLDLVRTDCIVLSVSTPWRPRPLLSTSVADINQALAENLAPHLAAARAFVPRMSDEAVFLGVGGGMADWVSRDLAPVAIVQAAQRNLYRGLARERAEDGPQIRELLIASMVNGRSNRSKAQDTWVTDVQVGREVCAVLADPLAHAGPIVTFPATK